VPLDDILGSITDESEKRTLSEFASTHPEMRTFFDLGEQVNTLRPRFETLGYKDKPEGVVSELERWRRWVNDDQKGWKFYEADRARIQEALDESVARVAELEMAELENEVSAAGLEARLRKTAQKIVVWVGAILIVAAGLYSPWVSMWGTSGGLRRPIGYYWLFMPPNEGFVTLDIPRLLLEWVMVAAICAALFFAAPVLTPSDQTRKRFRWFGRVVGGPVLTAAPLLILGAACLGLLYMGCMALQPWMKSVLPAGWVPKSAHWLFFYILLTALVFLLFGRALADEMKEIPGRPARRFILGLFALVKPEGAKQRPPRNDHPSNAP
jgi:hypothetical protein